MTGGRGAVRADLPAGVALPAPATGVHLGAGTSGPVTLRLFRRGGTRVVVAGAESPVLLAALLALRAASSGAAVRVFTHRPTLWAPLVRHGVDSQVLAVDAPRPPAAGPTLVVEDGAGDHRGGHPGPWQCRLELRTPQTTAAAGDLGALALADVALVQTLSATVALAAASQIGVPAATAVQLSALPPGTVGVLRRGAVEYVSLDPTPAEAGLLPGPGLS